MSDDRSQSTTDDSADESTRREEEPSPRLPESVGAGRTGHQEARGSRRTVILKKRPVGEERRVESGEESGAREKVEPLKRGPRPADTEKPVEAEWGARERRRSEGRLVVLRAFAIMIPFLVIVAAFVLIKKQKTEGTIAYDPELDLGKSEQEEIKAAVDPSGPIAWFNENPRLAYADVMRVLDRLNALEPGDEPEGLLRNEGTAKQRIAQGGLGWSSDFGTADPRDLSWSFGETGEMGYIIVEGRREDHRKFRSYFVKTPAGLRLDWEATTGWGEVPFAELLDNPPDGSVLVRCKLAKEAHFDTVDGPGSLRSWYVLRSADGEAHAWASVAARSALDKELLELFHYGRVILERLESVRVTLRLAKAEAGGRANELQIEELVSSEWVLPEDGTGKDAGESAPASGDGGPK